MIQGPIFRRRFAEALKELQDSVWKGGPPPVREDGYCVIVELTPLAQRDRQAEMFRDKPIIVACRATGLQATVGSSGQYDSVLHAQFEYSPTVISRWREIDLQVPE